MDENLKPGDRYVGVCRVHVLLTIKGLRSFLGHLKHSRFSTTLYLKNGYSYSEMGQTLRHGGKYFGGYLERLAVIFKVTLKSFGVFLIFDKLYLENGWS